MKNKLLVFLWGSFIVFPLINQTFNIAYNGTDANVSYETSWGKERFIKEDYLRYFKYYEKYNEEKEGIKKINPASVVIKNLTMPYSHLPYLLSFNPLGMYFNSKFIKKIFINNTIVKAVEIGSYYGLSTRHIASLLPKHGKLYAIDSWEYHAGMYAQFLSNVVLTGLTSKIIPIKKRSEDAVPDVKAYADSFDLIYVDGDHETEPVFKDLQLYYPLLTKNTGVICGDDWLLSSVRAAVVRFAEQNQLTIYAGCNFWFLRDEGAYKQVELIGADESIWKFGRR